MLGTCTSASAAPVVCRTTHFLLRPDIFELLDRNGRDHTLERGSEDSVIQRLLRRIQGRTRNIALRLALFVDALRDGILRHQARGALKLGISGAVLGLCLLQGVAEVTLIEAADDRPFGNVLAFHNVQLGQPTANLKGQHACVRRFDDCWQVELKHI